jgi:ribA/ribD-fused uncharacterized protein
MGIDHKYDDRDAPILGFRGPTKWLSNFWPADIKYEGLVYCTNENAFQANKFPKADRIPFTMCTPQEAKDMGQRPMSEPRLKDWMSGLREKVMLRINLEKYMAHGDLRNRLLATSNAYLEETNTWGDKYWGVCGTGENMLGRILMEIRQYFRTEWKPDILYLTRIRQDKMLYEIKLLRRVT